MLISKIKNKIHTQSMKSKLVEDNGLDRCLYKTAYGDYFWLDKMHYLDLEIINTSVWEPKSTEAIKKIVKNGDIVLDIGANIGYYSVLLSKLVGDSGRVIAFEPTKHYGEVLKKNLEVNRISNVSVQEYALSDRDEKDTIFIGESSATINWAYDERDKEGSEIIIKKKLDDIVDDLGLDKIDFIKIDIDGHEPAFLKGAIESIYRYKPIILCEIAHLNYLEAGVTAWDFYDFLIDNNMHIYYEDCVEECLSKRDFLIKCGNFAYSANIFITQKRIDLKNHIYTRGGE